MDATPKSADASTVAIDLAKDVFELAFADVDVRIVERRRLTRPEHVGWADKPSTS